MYYCYECRARFSSPAVYLETHGFAEPPYEKFYICPACRSSNFGEDERRRRYAK